jgi:hypothetical protein
MFCSNCGKKQPLKAQFCQSCGSEVQGGTSGPTKSTSSAKPVTAGQGFAITGIVLGSIALVIAFIDFGMIGSGLYDYVLPEEVGFLTITSVTGLVFAILALSKKNKMATLATVMSGSGLFLTLLLATYI